MAANEPITYYGGFPEPPLDATIDITSIDADGNDGTIIQGQNTTIEGVLVTNGTLTYTPPYQSSGGLEVKLYANVVLPDGRYDIGSFLGDATLVDTGQTIAGEKVYDWSANVSTSTLTSGIYDLEVFAQTTIISSVPNVPPASFPTDNNHPAFEYFNVVPSDTAPLPPAPFAADAGSAELSTDGRYVVFTNNSQTYETDLLTGAQTALSAGETPVGTFAGGQTIDSAALHFLEDDGDATGALAYTYSHTITSANGAYTFGAIGADHPYNVQVLQPYDNSDYYTGYDAELYPTVTDNATGLTTLFRGFGTNPSPDDAPEGIPVAVSDDGNTVLVENIYLNGLGNQAGSGYFIVHLGAAPELTINPVNGTNQFAAGNEAVTITGSSDAIGQTVEIDFGQAGNEVGTATVSSTGEWQYAFSASTISGTSLFIEASVESAAGTPAEASETAEINTLPPPTITSIEQDSDFFENSFGPNETLTILVNTSAPVFVSGTPELSLSNGEEATYSGGGPNRQLTFTYVAGIHDPGSADLSITGLLQPGGATIADSNGNALEGSFVDDLGLTLQTAPIIAGLFPGSGSNAFITNSDTPYISVGAEEGETITVYDNGIAVGTVVTPDYGGPGITYTEITPNVALPEGISTLTAVAVDGSGRSSTFSAPVVIQVDTIPPAETITKLAVNGNDNVDLTDQKNLNIVITGTVSAALQAGETVVIDLPGGENEFVTVPLASGATNFSVALTPYALAFGAGGSISAFIEDEAGNTSTSTSQSFTADFLRKITLVTADPSDPSQSNDEAPAMSGDGKFVAFEGMPAQFDGFVVGVTAAAQQDVTSGVYVENLATGNVTLAAADGDQPALSSDGSVLAYEQSYQIYLENLAAGTTTLITEADGAPADGYSESPSLSADGNKVAFLSSADDLVSGTPTGGYDNQVYVATVSDGVVTGISLASASASGDQGNGDSEGAALSSDGSEVAFSSTDTNLLAPGDPHTANLTDITSQVYVKALTTNTATGLQAGQVVLVSGLADGTVGDGYSGGAAVSANGRYVVFTSTADNLVPGASLPKDTAQIYVKDLVTGNISLISQTPGGVVGDYAASNPAISADGSTIVFSDASDNFGGGPLGKQLYAATLVDGKVNSLTLLSEPGEIPGDGTSYEASLAADGGTVAFQSDADNLAPGASGTHVYVTTTPAAPLPAAKTYTVTNTNDSGAGSLRAALAAAASGDTINFATAIKGGTIKLASSLTITDGVTIDGSGEGITIDGGGKVTDFLVNNFIGAAAVVEGLAIDNGFGMGVAGTNNTSADYLDGLGIPGGSAAGGIDLETGGLSLDQDSFADNAAMGGAGGDAYYDNVSGGNGGAAAGAIYAGAGTSLLASNISFSGNTSTGGTGSYGGGGGAGGDGGSSGGAIYIDNNASASLVDLTFSNNNSTAGAGGLDGKEKGAGGNGGVSGGAIYVGDSDALTTTNLSFSGNTATGGDGGAQLNNGTPAPIGYKGAGEGGSAAGGIYIDSSTAFNPVNFSFNGNSATAGKNGDNLFDSTDTAYADSNSQGSTGNTKTGGTAEDGYIVGATVGYENGSAPSTTTDTNGNFTLTGGSGEIYLKGGKDSATGLGFTDTLYAPAGSTIISPITNLVQTIIEYTGDSVAAAEGAVEAALALPSSVDLTSYDAEGNLLAAPANSYALEAAERVFAADNYLESMEQLIDAAGGSGPGTIADIASEIAAGTVVDLTNPANFIAASGLKPAAAAAVLDIANATVTAVAAQFNTPATPAQAFEDITGGSIAAQSTGAPALAAAKASGSNTAFSNAAGTYDANINQTLATGEETAAGNLPCFAAGTHILTSRGHVPVEHLRAGDMVVTVSGAMRAIKWLGHRTINIAAHPSPHLAAPILIRAGALADGKPMRDLYVSPDHALFFNNALVPAKALVNGKTILQVKRPEIQYFHVELKSHDIVLAEDTPAETYLETGNRNAFENGGMTITLHPDFAQTFREAQSCAPFLESGPLVEAIRRDILARAAIELTDEPDVRIEYCKAGALIYSRAAIPGEIFADPRDRRRLGVKISGLSCGGQNISLDHPLLMQGWHGMEPEGRWTNGAAFIPAALMQGKRELEVQLSATLRYKNENALDRIAA
jgi:hypothetical protein